MSTRAMACCAMVACAAAGMLAAPARANDSAHAVAEKFASEPDRAAAPKKQATDPKAEEARKREADRKAEDARKREAELKADKARQESAARRAAEALKADKEKADKAKRAKSRPAEDARIAAERRKAEEAEMLANARRESEEMNAAEEARVLAEQEAAVARAKAELLASQTAEQERAKADAASREAARKKTSAPDVEAEQALAEWARRADANRRAVRSLNRVREIRDARLAARIFREAARDRPAVTEPPRPDIAHDIKPPAATGSSVDTAAAPLDGRMPRLPESADPPKSEPARADQRRVDDPRLPARKDESVRESVVTVLIVMAPGTYGIRKRGPKVADPVLCTHEGCYVSSGAGTPAHFMPGRKALGFGNTMGARAGACRQQLGCIFRGIDIGQAAGYLQPVDLHILRHDRRQGQVIDGASDCRVDAGRVSCSRGIYADTYAMWVLPESMAKALGAAGLERALEEGLAAPRSADLNPRQMR